MEYLTCTVLYPRSQIRATTVREWNRHRCERTLPNGRGSVSVNVANDETLHWRALYGAMWTVRRRWLIAIVLPRQELRSLVLADPTSERVI